jgi:nonribosomal peptide synthetase DhbF
VRAWLYRLSAQRHVLVLVLVLVLHHIAGDGWSIDVLMQDVTRAYQARRAGRAPDWPDLPVQYADYALWQRELLGTDDDPGSELSRQASYWTSALAGLPEQLDLPYDRARRSDPSYLGGEVSRECQAESPAVRIRWAGRSGTSGPTCSTPGCGPSLPGSAVSCTWPGRSWRAVTWAGRP